MKSSSHEFFDEVAAISTPLNSPNNAYIFFPIALYPAGLEDSSGATPKTAGGASRLTGTPLPLGYDVVMSLSLLLGAYFLARAR